MTQPAAPKKRSIVGTLMKIVLPFLVTVGLCYLLFTGVDFKEMIAIIKRDCDFRWIAVSLVLGIVAHVVRARRWQMQLDAIGCHTPLYYLVLSIFGTYAVNLVAPRLGEFWRTAYIAQRQNAPFATVFGSMVCERLADTITVLLLTVVTFLLATGAIVSFLSRYPEVYNGILSLVASSWLWICFAIVVGFIVYIFRSKATTGFVAKIRNLLRELWTGFAIIAKMNRKWEWVIWTIALWGCYFTQMVLSFFAFPFTHEMLVAHGLIAPLVCFVLGSIAMGIPSNGGIGPYQIAIVFGLTIYMPCAIGTPASEIFKMNATAFANLVMGAQTIMLILLGIYTFIAIAISKRRVLTRH